MFPRSNAPPLASQLTTLDERRASVQNNRLGAMYADYLKAIGLDKGVLRSLEWLGGELTGDDDLVERFHAARDSVDCDELMRVSGPMSIDDLEYLLAKEALCSLFDALVDLETGMLAPAVELEAQAAKLNRESTDKVWTVEELDRQQREKLRERHLTPPYYWSEIEAVLASPTRAPHDHPKPDEELRCLECLEPMEWIWFRSGAGTWKMLCGREGWTPICRACHTWRACRIGILS